MRDEPNRGVRHQWEINRSQDSLRDKPESQVSMRDKRGSLVSKRDKPRIRGLQCEGHLMDACRSQLRWHSGGDRFLLKGHSLNKSYYIVRPWWDTRSQSRDSETDTPRQAVKGTPAWAPQGVKWRGQVAMGGYPKPQRDRYWCTQARQVNLWKFTNKPNAVEHLLPLPSPPPFNRSPPQQGPLSMWGGGGRRGRTTTQQHSWRNFYCYSSKWESNFAPPPPFCRPLVDGGGWGKGDMGWGGGNGRGKEKNTLVEENSPAAQVLPVSSYWTTTKTLWTLDCNISYHFRVRRPGESCYNQRPPAGQGESCNNQPKPACRSELCYNQHPPRSWSDLCNNLRSTTGWSEQCYNQCLPTGQSEWCFNKRLTVNHQASRLKKT